MSAPAGVRGEDSAGNASASDTSADGDSIFDKVYHAVIPGEFYYVREETTPKAGPKQMMGGAVCVYVLSLITFIVLIMQQSKVRTTVTTIEKTDISDDKWTCSMLNKVSTSLPEDKIGDTAVSRFSLVSVSESKSECERDLIDADPCKDGLFAVMPSGSAELVESGAKSYYASFQYDSVLLSCSYAAKAFDVGLVDLDPNAFDGYVLSGSVTEAATCTTLNRSSGHLETYVGEYERSKTESRLLLYRRPLFDTDGNTYFLKLEKRYKESNSFELVLNRLPENTAYFAEWNSNDDDIGITDADDALFGNDQKGNIYMLRLNARISMSPELCRIIKFVSKSTERWLDGPTSKVLRVVPPTFEVGTVISVYDIPMSDKPKEVAFKTVGDDFYAYLVYPDSYDVYGYFETGGYVRVYKNHVYQGRMEGSDQDANCGASGRQFSLNPNPEIPMAYCSISFSANGTTTNSVIGHVLNSNGLPIVSSTVPTAAPTGSATYGGSAAPTKRSGFSRYYPSYTFILYNSTTSRLGGQYIDNKANLLLETFSAESSSYHLSYFTDRVDGAYANQSTLKKGFTASSATWLACGSKIVDLTGITTVTRVDQSCKINGIRWDFSYPNSVAFTEGEFVQKVLNDASHNCRDTVGSGCDAVGDLPPYICLSEEPENFLNILSSAVANAQLAMSIFIMTAAAFLGQSGSSPSKEGKSDIAAVAGEKQQTQEDLEKKEMKERKSLRKSAKLKYTPGQESGLQIASLYPDDDEEKMRYSENPLHSS
jgi:hypothetical protein